MPNTSIVVCGQKFDIGTRVVLWDEPSGLCAYDTKSYETQDRKTGEIVVVSGKRYKSRLVLGGTPKLEKLKKIVWQFALHHSGLYRSRDTFEVLQQRGLSVHFICDDDGTLYQTLDVRERAYHIGGNNAMSVGVEIDSRATAGQRPDAYDEVHQRKYKVGPRQIRSDTIHGVKMKGFDYSDGQYAALVKLAKGLARIFPLIRPDFPRGADGKIIKAELKDPKSFKGFICHYHVTRTKIDPLAFDYARFLANFDGKTIALPANLDVPVVGGPDLSTWLGRQKALKILGYDPGTFDGIFGPRTKAALQAFQQDNGLDPDGIWGPNTETAMKGLL
jgi:hypothetical protein